MGSSDRKAFREFVESTLQISEDLAAYIVDKSDTRPMWTDKKRRKRIINAIMTCCPGISGKIQSVGQANVEACFVYAAGFFRETPEKLRETTNLETAAALWMRDYMEGSQEGVDFLREIMRDDDLQSLKINQVPMRDPVRPSESIDALTKIVTYRLSKDHYLYDDYSPSRLGPTDALYRKALETIDPETLEDAESVFLDRYMAYIEATMKVAKIYILEMDRTLEDISKKIPKPMNALSMYSQEDTVEKLLKEETESRHDPVVEMFFMLCYLPYLVVGMRLFLNGITNGDKVVKIAGEFDPLHTSDGRDVDPLTMAFGYCRMMDKNDDRIFLLGMSIPMMRIYAYLFPWDVYDYGEPSDYQLPAWCEKSRNIYALRIWRKQSDKAESNSTGCYFSLTQLIYRQTGLVLTNPFNEGIRIGVEKKTLTNNDIALMADSLVLMNIEMNEVAGIYDNWELPLEEEEQETEEPEEGPETEPGEEVSEREIQLQNELREAHELLKASERGRAAAEKELGKIREDTDSQRRELFDLRELIYRSLSENEPEEDVAGRDRELLPCTIQKKTLIFGGHESWRKAIKDMLIGVTIVPNRKQINTDLIRYADVVWIQVNAIPHAAYYTICDYARAHNVPIRYFTFNSAAACAIQLAKSDAEMKK